MKSNVNISNICLKQLVQSSTFIQIWVLAVQIWHILSFYLVIDCSMFSLRPILQISLHLSDGIWHLPPSVANDSFQMGPTSLILVLLPFLTMLLVDVNGQASSAKSIIDCKGKEGQVKQNYDKKFKTRSQSSGMQKAYVIFVILLTPAPFFK